ncbi:hypothetical protein ACM66B_006193 [Microbotryomycetes sp. NB124-2]
MVYLTDPDAHPVAADQIMGIFLKRYGPDNLVKMLEVSLTNHRHPKLLPEHAGVLKQPILLRHGTEDLVFPLEFVAEIGDALINAAEVDFQAVEGGPHMCFLTHADQIVPDVQKFFLRHSKIKSPVIAIDFEDALARLAVIGKDVDLSVAKRDASNVESFSLLDDEEIEYAQTLIDKYSILEKHGHSYNLNDAGDDDDSRGWTYGTRHEYTHKRADADSLTQKRPSIVEEIVVEYEEGFKSRRASVITDRRDAY